MAADARAREVEAKSREAEQARMQMAAAQAQTAALTKELSELKATQTDRGVVLTLGSALFATGKADVAPRSSAARTSSSRSSRATPGGTC